MLSIFKVFTIFTPKQQWKCIFIIFYMLIGAIFEAIGIGAIFPLISIIGAADFLDQHSVISYHMESIGVTNHIQFIMICSVALMMFYIVKNVYMAWQTKVQIRFSCENQIYYSEKLLEEYLQKPYIYHLNKNSSELLRNVNAGVLATFSGILVPGFMMITEIVTAIAIWGMLIFVDFFTAVIVAGVLGLMLYGILKAFRRRIEKQGNEQKVYSAVYFKWLNQSLEAIKETKILQKEEYFLSEFKLAYKKYGEANGDFLFLNQLPKVFIETIVICGLLMLIIVKLIMGFTPMDIIPLLGVLALAAFRLMPSINRIVSLSNSIKFQMPLFNEIYPDFMSIKERYLSNNRDFLKKELLKMEFNKTIRIEKISFHYPESEQLVLENISFEIPKGKFVGIIGPSGAGKTTFVDILLGLINPIKGRILVDGKNIYKSIETWQRILAYVPQSIYLIDGTLRENIALGIAEANVDEALLKKSLEMAELESFISSLPEKLNTMVGERGVKLSGGQRQRIGIARALYCQPEVLVLDEATSALDNETEKSITNTILKLKGKITIIAIAHRVSTLEQCDFKICFEDGKVKRI